MTQPPRFLPDISLLLLQASPLLKASVSVLGQQNAAKTNPAKSTPAQSQFALGTREIAMLFQRFRIRSMTIDQLRAFPLSMLTPAEKDFILFLRRNESLFKRLSALDHQPASLSPKDLRIAAQLAGDALMLTEEDLEYLKPEPARPSPALSHQGEEFQIDDLIRLLARLSPRDAQGLTLAQLQALRAEGMKLSPQEAAMLRFLQSAPVTRILTHLTRPSGGMVTSEILRIMASIIWNPALVGALPMVFLKGGASSARAALPVTETTPLNPDEEGMGEEACQVPLRLEWQADELRALLQRISPDGHVALGRLRRYQPRDEAEARILNALKNQHLFRALAGLDADGDTLSEADITLAMAEGALVLYDPCLMLVILP